MYTFNPLHCHGGNTAGNIFFRVMDYNYGASSILTCSANDFKKNNK